MCEKALEKTHETRSGKTGFQNPAYAGTVVAVAAGAVVVAAVVLMRCGRTRQKRELFAGLGL